MSTNRKKTEILHVGPAMMLLTRNGFLIKMTVVTGSKTKDVFFPFNREYAYEPWCQTKEKGRIMKENEYNRLKEEEELEERPLTESAHKTRILFILAKAVAKKLFHNPYWALTKAELEQIRVYKIGKEKAQKEKDVATTQDNMVNFRGAEKLMVKVA